MDEQTKEVLRRLDGIERPRSSALDHALCDAANLIIAQAAALRALREAPVGHAIRGRGEWLEVFNLSVDDIAALEQADVRLVPERGEVSDG